MIRNLCFLGAISCLICVAGTGLYIKQTFAASADAGESPAVAANPFADSKLVPASLLQVSERFSSVLWVELEEGLLHVLRRQQNSSYWQSVASRPVSIGKAGSGKQLEGDNKTPIGIYSVHDFIGDDELIDFYGVGAFPLNYPNKWDRLLGRTGSGIWLHGLPKSVRTRPRLDSEGCVVIDNKTLDWMTAYLEPERTRVVLGPKIRWSSIEQNQLLRDQLNQRLHDWLDAWSKLDTDAYLSFYHPEFSNGNKDLAAWAQYKRGVNRSKTWIDVSAREVNFFLYPGEQELVVLEYLQRYDSSNFEHTGRKVLFWQRGIDGHWQIVYEESGRL